MVWFFSLLHIASTYFLSGDLNLDPVQYLNISLGWGTVYLEVSAEEPELDVITCTTLKYGFATDFLCNLRLNLSKLFFPCLDSSAYKKECCEASLKSCKADLWGDEESVFG